MVFPGERSIGYNFSSASNLLRFSARGLERSPRHTISQLVKIMVLFLRPRSVMPCHAVPRYSENIPTTGPLGSMRQA